MFDNPFARGGHRSKLANQLHELRQRFFLWMRLVRLVGSDAGFELRGRQPGPILAPCRGSDPKLRKPILAKRYSAILSGGAANDVKNVLTIHHSVLHAFRSAQRQASAAALYDRAERRRLHAMLGRIGPVTSLLWRSLPAR